MQPKTMMNIGRGLFVFGMLLLLTIVFIPWGLLSMLSGALIAGYSRKMVVVVV
jgi:hypothetical protein